MFSSLDWGLFPGVKIAVARATLLQNMIRMAKPKTIRFMGTPSLRGLRISLHIFFHLASEEETVLDTAGKPDVTICMCCLLSLFFWLVLEVYTVHKIA